MKKINEYAHNFMSIVAALFLSCTAGMIFESSVKGEFFVYLSNFFLYQGAAIHYILFVASPIIFVYDLMLERSLVKRKPEWSDFFNSLALSLIGAVLIILLLYLLQTDIIKINHIFWDTFIVFNNLFALVEIRKIAINKL